MSTSDDRRPDARSRLVAAARDELVERGVSGISVRSIARRAKVTHAAPQYFFGDRAGLLTAIAAQGFIELSEELAKAEAASGSRLGVLGRVYLRFGLDNPALFELMFRPDQLHPDDPDLRAAQAQSISFLSAAATSAGDEPEEMRAPVLALVSWAFAHGLVALIRDGALQRMATDGDIERLADSMVDAFELAAS